MLNLVPLARARREMADRKGEVCFVGKFLQLQLPEPQARSVAAATVRRDHQSVRFGVKVASLSTPLTADGGDRERRRVMVRADIDETCIASQIVDSVGEGSRY